MHLSIPAATLWLKFDQHCQKESGPVSVQIFGMLEAFHCKPILFLGKDVCLTDCYCGYQSILEVLRSISEVSVVG